MDVYRKLRKVATRCVPDAARIWGSKKRHRDVIRDGSWLARQKRKGQFFFHGNQEQLSELHPYVKKTNLKKLQVLPLETEARERAEDELLQRYDFTFETMLVVLNPYGRTPLSAYIFFDTRESYYVAYTVKGRTSEFDFSYEAKVRDRRHRVPVFGLYAGTDNEVEVRLLNKWKETVVKKRLIIPTPPLPEKFTDMVEPVLRTEQTAMPFILITGGIKSSTYACDQNGDIRYYLSRIPRQYGIYPVSEGRFLFPERQINQPTYINSHANVLHDMDFLGRVRETYYVPGGTHHWMTEIPGTNGRLVLGAASSLKNRIEDMVICYDREEGKILRKYDLGELFPEKFQKKCDWAHLNCICYDRNGTIIVSLRNLHTVLKLDLKSGTVVWVMAHPKQYKKTALEEKVLRPEGEEFHFFFQQHAAEIVHTKKKQIESADNELEIMLFDNHCVTKRKAPWYDGEEKSFVCFYRISESDMTVKTEKVFPCALSPTRSNAWFDEDSRKIFLMAGTAGAVAGQERAQICEWDFDTEKEVNRYAVKDGFFRALPFQIQDREMEFPLFLQKSHRKGHLEPPVPILELPMEVLKWAKKPRELEVDFACMDNLILIRSLDHKIEKVFFCGDSVWERDYTDTYQKSEVFAQKVYYVPVPVESLPNGHYEILLQLNGKLYNSEKYFECEDF